MSQENLDRLSHPKMEWYREIYKDSNRWNGVDCLAGKTVIVYGEQGYGDTIQFARYIPKLKQQGCAVIFHCPQDLHRLFAQFGIDFLDKEEETLPDHDYHIPSMSLPFVLEEMDVDVPYLFIDEKEDFSELEDYVKIGIVWEGNPDHSNGDQRNCLLAPFQTLETLPVKMIVIQKSIHLPELTVGCDLELYGCPISDFYDTARIINTLDYVISVDTSVLHLAGALGKKTFGLLSYQCDPRWEIGINWYPDVTFFKQPSPGDWNSVLAEVKIELQKLGVGNG